MVVKAIVRRPYVMNMWEKSPKVWKLLLDIGILLKYKTLNIYKLPNKIVLASSHVLFVNADENRGRALLISNGVTQKRLNRFWSRAVEHMNPDLVIDAGVNYGECLFSVSYPETSRIYGIEANEHLLPYIEQSKNNHSNGSQITVVHAFASDMDHVPKDFYVDKHWSGTSSASYMPSHNMIEKVSVQTITIDSLCSDAPSAQRILFKIDVEGYEAFVMKGMKNLLSTCDSALGFIEFNSDYIARSGMCVSEFLAYLQTYFTIYFYSSDDVLVRTNKLTLEEMQSHFGSSSIHSDFVLVKNYSMAESLGIEVH